MGRHMRWNSIKLKTPLRGDYFIYYFFYPSSGEPNKNHIRVEKWEIPKSEVEGYIGNCEISLASKMEKKSVAVATLITTKISMD